MSWLEEHWLHVILVAGYLAILVQHARAGKRRTHTLEDYLAPKLGDLAGRASSRRERHLRGLSVLLVAASSMSRDPFMIGDRDPRAIKRTRIGIVAMSFVGMLLALNPFGDIVAMTVFSGSLYAACFLPTLVLGLHWRGGTATGGLACMFLGSATVIAWHFLGRAGWTNWHEVWVGVGVSFLVYIAASLLFGPRKGHGAPDLRSRQSNGVSRAFLGIMREWSCTAGLNQPNTRQTPTPDC